MDDGSLVVTKQGRMDVMNSDGTGRRAIGSGSEPAWSPDGRRIVYAGNGGFFIMDSDGRNRYRLVSQTPGNEPPKVGTRLNRFNHTVGRFSRGELLVRAFARGSVTPPVLSQS